MDNKAPTPPTNPLITLLNEMCYEILISHKKGKEYTRMIEQMLMHPVAMLGKDVCWTYAHEGRNEFLRAMLNGANKHMNEKQKDNKVKTVKRSRKAVIKESE